MNVVKEIERINAKELELGSKSSWHDDYKDSAYIFVGGLDIELTEGDVVTIFSQYGEIADVNMPRDKKTNKPRGFAFLMYEDQRSTVLAVDNLSGASVVGRTLRVDHVNKYKQLEKNDEGKFVEREQQSLNAVPENFAEEGGSDSDAASSHASIDPDDPMAAYLLEQARAKKRKKSSSKHNGESKEERRARKEEKRQRKAAKKDRKEDNGGHRHHHRSSRRPRDAEEEEEEQDLRERERRRPSRASEHRGDGYSDEAGSSRRQKRRDRNFDEDEERRERRDSRRARTRSRSPPRFTSDRYRRD